MWFVPKEIECENSMNKCWLLGKCREITSSLLIDGLEKEEEVDTYLYKTLSVVMQVSEFPPWRWGVESKVRTLADRPPLSLDQWMSVHEI